MVTIDAVTIFLLSRRGKGLSPQTIRWYRGIFKLFTTRYQQLPENPEAIESFLALLNTSDERRHGYYRALRALYNFLKRYKIPDVFEYIEAPRKLPKQPKFLMPYDINRLLSISHPPEIRAGILFLIDTGARLGELAAMQITDLNETPWGYLAAISGKTGERLVPICYEVYHALMVNLPYRYSSHWLGILISRAFKKAGVKGSSLTLRHTFGSLWSGDELVLQQIMGHRNLSTTKIYRHLRTRVLSEQHSQYSPLKMVLSSSRSML